MRFVSVFVTALAVLSSSALPTEDARRTVSIADRVVEKVAPRAASDAIPSVKEIKKHMRSSLYVANKSLFYSGPGGYRPRALAYGHENARLTLDSFWTDPHYPDPWVNDTKSKFWDNASAAMAQLSSLEVFVLLPSDTNGTNWFKGTVWDRVEWPTLTQENPWVTRIVRVNPDNDRQEVIHEQRWV